MSCSNKSRCSVLLPASQLLCLAASLLLAMAGEVAVAAQEAGKITVVPATVELAGRDSRQQLVVTLQSPGGRERDLTRTAEYLSQNPKVAAVTSDGVVTPAGSGETVIVVRHDGHEVNVPIRIRDGERDLPLDFRRDISPLLTKAGCNGGGCHGKSGGRGEFQLSLFGYDPRTDYEGIVKASRGRRLFLSDPARSLLVAKPIGDVPHGGGIRFRKDDPEYQRMLRWIAAGTPWSDESNPQAEDVRLLGIEVFPAQRALGHDEQQQVIVTARYSDGTRRDVTRTTEFRANDTSIAEVDALGLVTTQDRLGETAVVAIYQGFVGVCNITVPLTDPTAPTPELPAVNLIDEHVLAKLRQLGVPPSPPADDATFLRRASLQITGQVPTAAEVQAFVDDRSSDKRRVLVARLLDSGAHADFFTQKWCDILRIKRRGSKERVPATIAFHRWFRNAWAANMPYDELVRRIVTASGSPADNPAVQWYHEVRSLESYVDDTAQVFLGVRIGCARCHNHPFENFSQEDYFGLAAFFARVDRTGGAGVAERRANETIFLKPTGEVRHPVTGKVVPPHGLRGQPVEVAPLEDPRHALVDWMREPENPYFARALVNRMWAHFFGRGLVAPLDDLRDTNPAANEPLLDALSRDFIASGYDIRHLLTTICTSATYGLSSEPNAWNLADTQFNSRFYPQRLSAEVLLDAVDQVTGIPTRYAGLPEGTRATQLPDEGFANAFLRLFGKPPRESACECERVAEPSLGQSLFLMNDSFFLQKINADKSLADRLARGSEDDAAKVRNLFLTVLSREPSEAELKAALAHIAEEEKPITAYRNLVWVLLNTKEFLYVR